MNDCSANERGETNGLDETEGNDKGNKADGRIDEGNERMGKLKRSRRHVAQARWLTERGPILASARLF